MVLASSQSASSGVALTPPTQVREMLSEFDQMRESLRDQAKVEASTVAVTAAASLGLSVGYVVWLLRGGVLVSSLLSSLPAWRFVDPLPILGRLDDDQEDGDSSDDSLETIVAENNRQPHARSADSTIANASQADAL